MNRNEAQGSAGPDTGDLRGRAESPVGAGGRPVRTGPRPLRWLFMALGFFFVGLGGLGVLLPGLPTTPFMLLAAWMFSKSSPRFHAWLWNHRVFGPYVQNWEKHRVIPMKAKLLSSGVMTLGMGIMIARSVPWIATGPALALCGVGAAFIWRCPSAPPEVAAVGSGRRE